MSKKTEPETKDKLLDSLIDTIVHEGFTTGIDDIVAASGICKMTAYAHFQSRTGMTVAALERVGNGARLRLGDVAASIGEDRQITLAQSAPFFRCFYDLWTDPVNPLGFITMCLTGSPDPLSPIHKAAVKETDALSRRVAGIIKDRLGWFKPKLAADRMVSSCHGAFVCRHCFSMAFTTVEEFLEECGVSSQFFPDLPSSAQSRKKA